MEGIEQAIEHAVAASRWRIVARFETGATRERFLRLSSLRSEQAREILDQITASGTCQCGRAAEP